MCSLNNCKVTHGLKVSLLRRYNWSRSRIIPRCKPISRKGYTVLQPHRYEINRKKIISNRQTVRSSVRWGEETHAPKISHSITNANLLNVSFSFCSTPSALSRDNHQIAVCFLNILSGSALCALRATVPPRSRTR